MSTHLITRSLTLTRTADVPAAYTAGDVVGRATAAGGAVLSFASGGGSGNPFMITGSELRIDLTAVPATMTSFRLQLYNATPPSALGDHGAWDLPAGDAASYIGYIDLGTPVDVGSTLYVQAINLNKAVRVGENATLFAYLQTIGTYTPASGTTHLIALHAEGY
jgi:hypothetical protein